MSEEKMRDSQWQQAGWIASWLTRHAINLETGPFVELQDHLAALQESEAGAVAEVRYSSHPFKDQIITWTNSTVPPVLGAKLYPAPPSAQAIETAAIMKCADLMVKRGVLSTDGLNYEALLALIPQDGRTQLEELGMKVAAATYNEHPKKPEQTLNEWFRAIVTNLIGEKS